jgi:hypothetical protein
MAATTATPASPDAIGEERYIGLTNSEDTITAGTGATQATAYQLTAQLNRVTESTSGGTDSVALPKISNRAIGDGNMAKVGQIVVIRNDSSYSITVYGGTGVLDTINSVATGTGVSLAAAKTTMYIAQSYTKSTDVGNWITILTA